MNKEKPILFSTPMVQAILEGRKTQTRRIIKPSSKKGCFGIKIIRNSNNDITDICGYDENEMMWDENGKKYPVNNKYEIGDILWVRETFMNHQVYGYIYKADNNKLIDDIDILKWKPSIFMPKEAARIFLKVTNIRIEKLQDISEQDAINEGIGCGFIMNAGYPDYEHIKNGICTLTQDTAYASFISLWTKINGKESWVKNPYVWVYGFEKLNK